MAHLVYYYRFEACVDIVVNSPKVVERLVANAKTYVEAHYTRDREKQAYIELLQGIEKFPCLNCCSLSMPIVSEKV